MTQTSTLSDTELRRQVHRLIIEEFGVTGLLRYVKSTSGGSGNWEAERQQLLAGTGTEELLEEMRVLRAGREQAS